MTLGAVLAALVTTLAAGYGITRIPPLRVARIAAWLLVVAAVAGVERIASGSAAGFRMIVLILGLLYAMKAVVCVESRGEPGLPLRPIGWTAFASAWFGMRPQPFAHLGGPPRSGARDLALSGATRLGLGAVLFVIARIVWEMSPPLATVVALVGLSLMLHFGVFNLVAAFWRRFGVDVRALFREPLRSTSLSEFWGRRWNMAFSEMTAVGVYGPLKRSVGAAPALAAAFLFSGLLHELAISLPVRAGFGLPLLYFGLHAILMSLERILAAIGRPINAVPWIGRAWTLAWLIAPLPILFHPPFLAGVVWPLLAR